MFSPSDITLLIVIFVSFIVFAFINWWGIEKLVNKFKTSSNSDIKQQEHISKPASRNLVVDTRKQRFIETRSIVLHYINEAKFRSFYNSQFNEDNAILESMVDETTKEVQGSIGAGISGVLDTNAGSKLTRKQVSNLKPKNEEIHVMFLKYQRANIENDTVTLGLEDSELDELDKLSAQIKEDFSLPIPENFSSQLAEKIAQKVVDKFKLSQKWILIEADFDIKREGEYYKCVHKHGVNKYISDNDKHITISFTFLEKDIETEMKNFYKEKPSRRLIVYGYVVQHINPENAMFDLQILPLAIY